MYEDLDGSTYMDANSARLANVAKFPIHTTVNEYIMPAGPPLPHVSEISSLIFCLECVRTFRDQRPTA